MSLQIHSLTFNPFEENMYIIIADSGVCICIDPGSTPSNGLSSVPLKGGF